MTSTAVPLEILEQFEEQNRVSPRPRKKQVAKVKNVPIPHTVILLMTFIFAFCAGSIILLSQQAKFNEIGSEINEIQDKIAIAESETVRLKNEYSALYSLESVEAFAEEHGMVKVQSYQISYLDLSEGDKIIVSGSKPRPSDTPVADFFQKIINGISRYIPD